MGGLLILLFYYRVETDPVKSFDLLGTQDGSSGWYFFINLFLTSFAYLSCPQFEDWPFFVCFSCYTNLQYFHFFSIFCLWK